MEGSRGRPRVVLESRSRRGSIFVCLDLTAQLVVIIHAAARLCFLRSLGCAAISVAAAVINMHRVFARALSFYLHSSGVESWWRLAYEKKR